MRAADVRLESIAVERLRGVARALLQLGSLGDGARGERDAAALDELVERMRNNHPYHDAHYAGRMLQPPHTLAWAAYATTMLLNPNNHALDGGPATAQMEREAVDSLAHRLGQQGGLGT